MAIIQYIGKTVNKHDDDIFDIFRLIDYKCVYFIFNINFIIT